jgi:REP element-mobilizing transposase RayT
MVEAPVLLDSQQRETVNQAVRDHCKKRNWHLHAVNCRSNHCHVVVTAPNYDGKTVRNQLKGWAKRGLKKLQKDQEKDEIPLREHWWTKGGSVRVIFELDPLNSAIEYTLDAQDLGGSSGARD